MDWMEIAKVTWFFGMLITAVYTAYKVTCAIHFDDYKLTFEQYVITFIAVVIFPIGLIGWIIVILERNNEE